MQTLTDIYTSDAEYDAYVRRMEQRFQTLTETEPLFTTSADEGIWEKYLHSMHPERRQYHTCHACKNFIERYGTLVCIRPDGTMHSPIWDIDEAPTEYKLAVTNMLQHVLRSKVTGIFLTTETTWGKPITGEWHHLAVCPPRRHVYERNVLTAGQKMAEKLQDYITVQRALVEWKESVLIQALALLRADTLYRSEKVLGQAEWLHRLSVASKEPGSRGRNAVWRAIATAPAGFCHPRASMIGTLLDDIASGADFAAVSARFKEKMHPLQYQRPTAPPKSGAIKAAEELFETMGLAPALERRYARLEEVEALWKPVAVAPAQQNGIFGHLLPTEDTPELVTPPIEITWEKFQRTILPDAQQIDVNVPARGSFCALVTAVHADAPRLLQWDTETQRNPVSWYLYHGGSTAHMWGLKSGWLPATALTLAPHAWYGGNYPHQGAGVLFLLPNMKDTRDSELALFPETLRTELHGVRAVIEAYSKSRSLAGREEASANGLLFSAKAGHVTVRVTPTIGPRMIYKIDRWD